MKTFGQLHRPTTVRLQGLTGALVALALIALATAGPAQATAYRYWSYWQGATGTWVMAQTGPSDYQVVDQDVQGWRFGISTAEVSQRPDGEPDFAELCSGLLPDGVADGQLRVAVVIDSGFRADAPAGQTPPADEVNCVTVPEGSTGAQALAAATTVTESGGMICAVNGYPADECSAELSDAEASAAAEAAATEGPAVIAGPSASPTAEAAADSSSPAGFLVGAALLAALLAAALGIPALRRRQRATGRPDRTDGPDATA